MEKHLFEIPNRLADLIDKRCRNLSDRFQGVFSVKEVQEELRELDTLLASFRLNDEHLEKLLKESTERHDLVSMVAEMRDQRRASIENREVLERLHAESHKLMLGSARLIADCKRGFDRRTRIHGNYASEMCAHCEGLGGSSDSPCIACNGVGTVLVHQPPFKCPRCNGEGKAAHQAMALFHSDHCLVCQGTGWVMVMNRSRSAGKMT